MAETRSRVIFGSFGSDLRKNLAWTPDGHWIVAQASRNRRIVGWFVLVFRLDGRKKADEPIAHGLFGRKPRILSLRRCYCLCPSCKQGRKRVVRLALSKDFTPSGSARRLTREGGSASHPVWTKDGSRIIYRLGSELRVVDSRNSDASERIPLEAGNINS